MANVDRPFGVRVAQLGSATNYTAKARKFYANDDREDTNNAGDIYVNDVVTLDGGYIKPAATGDAILGVVVGVGPVDSQTFGRPGAFDPDNLSNRSLPYDEAGVVYVVDDPDVVLEIQEDADDSADALEFTDIGDVRDLTVGATDERGSRTTHNSTVELSSTLDTEGDFRIVGFVMREDNEVGPKAKWLVRINNHFYNQ